MKARLLAVFQSIFDPDYERDSRWFVWSGLIIIYLAGVFFWGYFLNWGDIPFTFEDWGDINAPRIAFLQDAMRKGELPLHMPDGSALHLITDRFMALPDVILAPQMAPLAFLSTGQFIFVDTLILYTLGTLGLLWFRKKYRLSLLSYTVLFLVFNLNGHIQAHYSVGHITWGGYLLFPWLIVLIFDFLDREGGWRWVASVSFLLFFMLLQGAYHQVVMSLMFLGLLGLVCWKRFLYVIKTLLVAGLLSAVRLLPPALELGKFNNQFFSGYPTVNDILTSLAVLKQPAEAILIRSKINPNLTWWEFDLYVGLIGTVFILFFGLVYWLKKPVGQARYLQLFFPALVLSILSVGQIFRLIRVLPIPLLTGERASSRLITLPFIIVAVFAAINFQDWLRSHPLSALTRIALVGLVLPLASDLFQHAHFWRVTEAVQDLKPQQLDWSTFVVSNHPDPPYVLFLSIGLGVTLITAIFLVYEVLRESRHQHHPAIRQDS